MATVVIVMVSNSNQGIITKQFKLTVLKVYLAKYIGFCSRLTRSKRLIKSRVRKEY